MCGPGSSIPTWLAVLLVPVAVAGTAGTAVVNYSAITTRSAFNFFNPEIFQNKIAFLTHKISVVGLVASDQKKASWYLRRGILHILSRNPSAAIEDFQQSTLLFEKTKSFLPNYLLATLYQFQGEFSKAVLYYSAAIDVTEGQNLAEFLEKEVDDMLHGKTERIGDLAMQARDAVTSLFQPFQLSSRVKQQMSETVAADTKQLAALKAFNDSLKKLTNATLYNNRGSCYLNANMDELQSAFADFSQAFKLEPDNVMYLFNCGLTMFYARNFDQAYKLLTDCINLYTNQKTSTASTSAAKVAEGQEELVQESEATVTIMKNAYRLRAFTGLYMELDKQSISLDMISAGALSTKGPLIALNQLFYYRMLPEALIPTILSFLPKRDLIKAMQTCRHMYKHACSPFLWSSITFNAKNVYMFTKEESWNPSVAMPKLAQVLESRNSKVTRLVIQELMGVSSHQNLHIWECIKEASFDKVADGIEELEIRGTDKTCSEINAAYSSLDFASAILRFKNLRSITFVDCKVPCTVASQIGAGLKLEKMVLQDCHLDATPAEYELRMKGLVTNIVVQE